jgi:hypothetical protein
VGLENKSGTRPCRDALKQTNKQIVENDENYGNTPEYPGITQSDMNHKKMSFYKHLLTFLILDCLQDCFTMTRDNC